MNSALAALFGAVGGGARSYGTNTIREEQQAAMEQQRMNELKQQEAMRINVAREAASAAESARLRENQELTAALSSMNIIQPGQTATKTTAPFYSADAANKRATAANDASMERTAALIEGRSSDTAARGETARALESMRGDIRTGIASMNEAGRDRRQPDPREAPDKLGEMTAKRAMELMQPRKGEFGMESPGLSGPAARAQAEQEVQAAYGRPNVAAQAATPQRGNPQEQDLMQRLNAAIQQINALPIDPQEKQARIQEANRRVTERARQMRGGA